MVYQRSFTVLHGLTAVLVWLWMSCNEMIVSVAFCSHSKVIFNRKINIRPYSRLRTELYAQGVWRNDEIPSGIEKVEEMAALALREALLSSSSSISLPTDNPNGNPSPRVAYTAYSVDVLTPGLNAKLEQKAMLQQEYLFRVLLNFFPVLKASFAYIIIMFPSVGDAASFEKHCRKISFTLSQNIIATGLNVNFPFPTIDDKAMNEDETSMESLEVSAAKGCVVFVNSKNNVGDPVMNEIKQILVQHSHITGILLNCDLSDKVATGMQQKRAKDEFRASIKQAFYFRNIVSLSRPSLVPTEIGALLYRPKQGWQLFVVNQDEIYGPGSLNRFMVLAVFKRHPNDPTVENPPYFSLAASFTSQPKRDEIDSAMSRASSVRPLKTDDIPIDNIEENISMEPINNLEQAITIITTALQLRNPSNRIIERIREAILFLDKDKFTIINIPTTPTSSSTTEVMNTIKENRSSMLDVLPGSITSNRNNMLGPTAFEDDKRVLKTTTTNIKKNSNKEEIWELVATIKNINDEKSEGMIDFIDSSGSFIKDLWTVSGVIAFTEVEKSDNVFIKSEQRYREYVTYQRSARLGPIPVSSSRGKIFFSSNLSSSSSTSSSSTSTVSSDFMLILKSEAILIVKDESQGDNLGKYFLLKQQ